MKNFPILTRSLAVTLLLGASFVPVPGTSPVTALPAAEGEQPDAADERNAEETAQGDAGELPAAGELVTQAREKLAGYRTVKARIVETVKIGDRRFTVNGSYQQGTGLKLRLSYEVKLNTMKGTLLQVCDGQTLWTRHKIGEDDDTGRGDEEDRITRRDVREILEAAESTGRSPRSRLVTQLGLGGMPALLASIQDAMNFTERRIETVDDKPFIVIQGGWKQEFLYRWRQGGGGESESLPNHVPDIVRIYLDRDNLFPHRIQYLKQPPERDFYTPMVTLNFVEVVLNAELNEDDFYFVPPDGVTPVDITKAYIERLKQGAGGQTGDQTGGTGQ